MSMAITSGTIRSGLDSRSPDQNLVILFALRLESVYWMQTGSTAVRNGDYEVRHQGMEL